MGLQSALSTALTGLNAAETTIDVVGNNVANSQTVGFKSSNAIFATQFLQTQSLGSSPTDTRGGTNPRQTGLGTKVAEISPDFTQGTIELSSNPLDLAIQGDGFFIVRGTQDQDYYTRNGQFKTNAANELVTSTGQRVLGYGVENNVIQENSNLQTITIPLGNTSVAQETENVYLQGSLPPSTDPLAPEILLSDVLSDGSFDIPSDLLASDANAVSPPSTTGISLAGAATGGSLTASGTYTYRFTFVDSDGNESTASTALSPVTLGAGEDSIDVTDIPTPLASAGFVYTRVYRTDGTGTGGYSQIVDLDAATIAGLPGGVYTDTAADSVGASIDGALDTGNYSYYITFYNSSNTTESRPTSLVGPISISSTGSGIRLQNIPDPTTAPSGNFDQVRIYRSPSDDSNNFYLLDTLTAPGGGGPFPTSYIDKALDSALDQNSPVNLDGPAANGATLLVDLSRYDGSQYLDNFFEPGTLYFTGSKGGSELGTKQFVIDSSTTVGQLNTFLDESLGIQSGGSIPGNPGVLVVNGQIRVTGNNGGQNSLDIDSSAFSLVPDSTGVARSINLEFGSVSEATGQSAVTNFIVYDSLGAPINVRLTAVLESTTSSTQTYRWFADSSDNAPATGSGSDIAVGTGTITFTSDGSVDLLAGGGNTVTVFRNDSPANPVLTFDLDFSELSGLAHDTASLAATRQDGSPPGVLTSFIVTESGTIRGVFSNGVSQDLGQVVLAKFSNNGGLEQLGDNLFAEGVNSGVAVVSTPGSGGLGTITAGAVELSNTDIGQNLIDLILASTQYRGGTRVITAAQELLDELLALRR